MRIRMHICMTFVLLSASALTLMLKLQGASKDDDAADTFKSKCSMCHGPEGKGFSAIKTPDFTDPKWQAKLSDEQIKDTIKNGKKDTMMKGFGDKLKDDEIDSLVKFIRSLNSAKKK